MHTFWLVNIRNFAVSQSWAPAQNALFVRKIVENHVVFVLKMSVLVPSSHSLTTFLHERVLSGDVVTKGWWCECSRMHAYARSLSREETQ